MSAENIEFLDKTVFARCERCDYIEKGTLTYYRTLLSIKVEPASDLITHWRRKHLQVDCRLEHNHMVLFKTREAAQAKPLFCLPSLNSSPDEPVFRDASGSLSIWKNRIETNMLRESLLFTAIESILLKSQA